MKQYDDIIHLPHHQSATRSRMPHGDRAAQFAPFAALNGYGAAIAETGRLTDTAVELMEAPIEAVNEGLRAILMRQREQPEITVTYFEPDKRKAGGAYRTVTGRVQKFMEFERMLLLHDGILVPFDAIYELMVR